MGHAKSHKIGPDSNGKSLTEGSFHASDFTQTNFPKALKLRKLFTLLNIVTFEIITALSV